MFFYQGFHITFSTSLEPSVVGYKADFIEDIWMIVEDGEGTENGSELADGGDAIQSEQNLLKTYLLQNVFVARNSDSSR